MQTSPAIFEENRFGTENIGIIGMDAKWSKYGEYLQRMSDIVQIQFEKLIVESRIYPPNGSTVVVKFILNSEGKITRIISVQSRTTDSATRNCTSALTIPSPYGPWTDDMKALLGEEQEFTWSFYYQ